MPDEPRHIGIGQDIVAKYCTSYELQQRVKRVATIVAKQYCIGFAAAMSFAAGAKEGKAPRDIRDQLALSAAASIRGKV
ncbi:hypothetical protein ABIC10_002280 [Bradyrhizobium sp. S3.2.12]